MLKLILSAAVVCVIPSLADTFHYPIDLRNVSEVETVPGYPAIPRLTKKILLPYGKELGKVTFQVKESERSLRSVEYAITPMPRPLCDSKAGKLESPSFRAGEVYPPSVLGDSTVSIKHGYRVAHIPLYPVQYFPITKEGIFTNAGELIIELKDTKDDAFYRGLEIDRKEAASLLEDGEHWDTYPSRRTVEDAQYLVIGPQALLSNTEVSGLSFLLAEKNHRGITTQMITTEEINTQFTGSSLQQKIRNAIRAFYKDHGTSYVLLVGNGYSSTPSKSLSTSQGSVLADYYYACLNGEFTSGSPDTACEVAVGRMPASTLNELQILIGKTFQMANLEATDPRVQKSLLFGEKLDSSTYAWKHLDQLAKGGQAGSIATQGYPTTAAFTRLSESSSKTYTAAEVVAALNSGEFYTVNHLGHANESYCMRFNSSAIPGIKNALPFFGITQGCHPGDIKGPNWTAKLLTQQGGGAGAMISNSGYGWYSPGSNDGPSNRQHLVFYDVVFREGLKNLGKIHYRAKEKLIPDMKQTLIRYVVYETNLFGDPELALKF